MHTTIGAARGQQIFPLMRVACCQRFVDIYAQAQHIRQAQVTILWADCWSDNAYYN
jgi:hypothetical protein